MLDLRKNYQRLIEEAHAFLKQECTPDSSLQLGLEDYSFFLELAQQRPLQRLASPAQAKPAPTPTAAVPLPASPVKPPQTTGPSTPVVRKQPAPAKKEKPSPDTAPKRGKSLREDRSKEMRFSDAQELLRSVSGRLHLIEEIPSDASAIAYASRWQHPPAPVTCLVLHQESQWTEREFVNKVCQAIHERLGSSRLIRLRSAKDLPIQVVQSPELKAVVLVKPLRVDSDILKEAVPSELWAKIKTVSMERPTKYLQDPSLKADLWQQLQQLFADG